MREILELAAWVAFVGAVYFVFVGEPDLWDKWHALAMQAASGCTSVGDVQALEVGK